MCIRDRFQDVPHPELGSTLVARSPFKFSDIASDVPFRAPYLGEHNDEILASELGYNEDMLNELYRKGVIIRDPKIEELRAKNKM